jgi:hypothetical protein
MTCFSVWVAQNQQNIPKIVIVTEIHSAFSVSITFPLHCEFAPVLVMASQRLQLSVLQSVCRVSLDGMATLGPVRGRGPRQGRGRDEVGTCSDGTNPNLPYKRWY